MGVHFPAIHSYDVAKWIHTFNQIYQAEQTGYDRQQVFETLTKDWEPMERQDFQQWIKFYEEQAHLKYTTAAEEKNAQMQANYLPMGGGLFPLDALKAKVPEFSLPPDAKEEINKKIRSIVSRLNAAERLATEPEIQRALQQYLDIGVVKWLEELQRVKRLIQVVPLRHAKSATLTDILMKRANEWEIAGYPKTAQTFRIIAQETPNEQPGDSTDLALEEIIKGMNPDDEDTNEVRDVVDDPIATISIKAQEVPSMPKAAPAPAAMPAPPTLKDVQAPDETLDPAEPNPVDVAPEASTDVFEVALNSVTVADVILDLEGLANIFRNREISRTLSKIDLKLDHLGIASFFPSLAEANSKTLEGNQYALSRIEDVLAKLRGSVETPIQHQVDLGGEKEEIKPIPNAPIESVKNNLKQEQMDEKARKERRKEQESQKVEPLAPPPMAPPTVQPAPAPTNIPAG